MDPHRVFHGLRFRMATLFVVGLILTALVFDVLLIVVARRWFADELAYRGRALVTRVAHQASTPLLIGDRVGLRDEVRRLAEETDLIGITVFAADGTSPAEVVAQPRLWNPGAWGPAPRLAADSVAHVSHRVLGSQVHVFEIAIVRRSVSSSSTPIGVDDLVGDRAVGPASAGPIATTEARPIGWVRLVVSSARLERSLGAAGYLGLLLLGLAVLFGVVGASLLMRFVVQPLREASDLARGVAAGHLERRLPVRSADELGALAESMNTMAVALDAAQRRERAEAATLRNTAEAVVVVAQAALASHDPASIFRVVATQVRRVSDCQGAALVVSSDNPNEMRFAAFDPEPSWGGLEPGMVLEPEMVERMTSHNLPLVRLALSHASDPFSARLARSGYRSALLVPLSLAGGPPALLLIASRKDDGFSPAEARVVAGLASHLSAALRASQLRDRLEQAFGKLEATQEQLVRSEKLRATGELASGVAHDFNNVLGAILGRVQLLRRKANEKRLAPAQLLESLGVMELAARDGAETVRRLRQFSHGDDTREAGAVELAEALEGAAKFTSPRWKDEALSKGRSISLTVECAAGLYVVAPGSELREVFTNLILNAVDALPRGGTIRLSSSSRDGRAIARVEDNGVGMTPETQRRVFDPFFTTKGPSGTGLGMSVVYGIVERLGGSLTIDSEPGRGTAVELSMPLAPAPAPAAHAAIAKRPGRVTHLDVLVVDDEGAVRDLVGEICVTLGHRVTLFESAQQALDAYHPGRFHLVLTDLGMPGMTGWELARAIRAIDPQVTIVFVTGWGQEVDREAVQRAGADAVIAKPFTIEDIDGITGLIRKPRDRAA